MSVVVLRVQSDRESLPDLQRDHCPAVLRRCAHIVSGVEALSGRRRYSELDEIRIEDTTLELRFDVAQTDWGKCRPADCDARLSATAAVVECQDDRGDHDGKIAAAQLELAESPNHVVPLRLD